MISIITTIIQFHHQCTSRKEWNFVLDEVSTNQPGRFSFPFESNCARWKSLRRFSQDLELYCDHSLGTRLHRTVDDTELPHYRTRDETTFCQLRMNGESYWVYRSGRNVTGKIVFGSIESRGIINPYRDGSKPCLWPRNLSTHII